jgi:hypothetical protein
LDPEGRLWITESCNPGSACSWQSYAIRLSSDTVDLHPGFTGPVVVGADGISVRMHKAR